MDVRDDEVTISGVKHVCVEDESVKLFVRVRDRLESGDKHNEDGDESEESDPREERLGCVEGEGEGDDDS